MDARLLRRSLGIRAIMQVPTIGTYLVVILVLLISFESKVGAPLHKYAGA